MLQLHFLHLKQCWSRRVSRFCIRPPPPKKSGSSCLCLIFEQPGERERRFPDVTLSWSNKWICSKILSSSYTGWTLVAFCALMLGITLPVRRTFKQNKMLASVYYLKNKTSLRCLEHWIICTLPDGQPRPGAFSRVLSGKRCSFNIAATANMPISWKQCGVAGQTIILHQF